MQLLASSMIFDPSDTSKSFLTAWNNFSNRKITNKCTGRGRKKNKKSKGEGGQGHGKQKPEFWVGGVLLFIFLLEFGWGEALHERPWRKRRCYWVEGLKNRNADYFTNEALEKYFKCSDIHSNVFGNFMVFASIMKRKRQNHHVFLVDLFHVPK